MGHELWNPRSPGSPEWDETAAGGETRLRYKIKQSVKDNHNSWGKIVSVTRMYRIISQNINLDANDAMQKAVKNVLKAFLYNALQRVIKGYNAL